LTSIGARLLFRRVLLHLCCFWEKSFYTTNLFAYFLPCTPSESWYTKWANECVPSTLYTFQIVTHLTVLSIRQESDNPVLSIFQVFQT
jgi:hypothetical protein